MERTWMGWMEGEKGKQLYFNLVNCFSLSRPQSFRSLSHEVLSPPSPPLRPLVNLDLRTRTPFQRESFSERASESSRVESSQATAVSEYFIAN